ncbi:Asp23/Gls24 family envelope stress response protein [Halanaerobiaceae bacterium Z-7014]|uniref:Asp23/Gls24 family envelope stress response protein n=1 Tax=Halonatronomonas betaini TaxID=2778430 RepID=A0A931AW24_9FIRM|nr:Asp23/Gls24 family envelope stress response protein [Halonatronomonas betaini]MBF8437570.1 Asp23/Gls24 family envelope stress response protein [Halonatronomonas betaini]
MPNKKIGEISISDDVIGIIASLTVIEIEGVYSMSGGFAGGLANVLGRSDLSRGVKIDKDDNEVKVELYLILEYEYSIPDLAWKIQDKVKRTLEAMTGLNIIEVNIHVQGVNFPEGEEKDDIDFDEDEKEEEDLDEDNS